MVNKQPHLFCFGLGYTGTVLAGSLRDLGWQVSGTTREPSDGSDAYPFSGHAEEVEAIAATLRTATHVLSTIPTMELGDPILAAVEQVLAECEDLTWIGYLSTTGVYGNTDGAVVDETTPTNPSGERGMRRVRAEKQWLNLYGAFDLPVHVFRLPGIYGPGRSVFDQLKHGKSQRILKPGHKFNRIHVDDIAQALIASMKQPDPGAIYNVCDDHPVEPAEVTAYACEVMGTEPPPLIDFFEAEKSMSAMGRSFWNDNRLVSNGRIKSELGVALIHPDYKSGLDAIWALMGSQYDE
ncbi:MAG: SDR family oxidoreductase [Rhodospirillales bacterium]|nr:SDR family oxidoreductase [Rhodospirillales bacterium]MBT4039125.1 SDR family oxidoreductase [Rhodospirillales bacterium]MBT4625526.1 SDR family oxidoreductase [Rhodospirillales bacterium]MBT5352164.1 SDR family oxidoreductase [Rhodospirillales bacterium]MBT5521933.1 SDR family oxidoreductase [Rhodospirillales bacterium]